MGKVWPALDIYLPACDPQLAELVLAELDDFRPTAIQDLDDNSSRLRAFFDTSESRHAAAHALAASFRPHLIVEPIDIDDEDWAARSQAALRAITVGRLVIAPPWDTSLSSDPRTVRNSAPPWGDTALAALGSDPGTVRGSDPVVVIRPSMGFGTGHHATTRLALKALQNLPLEGRSVLDIGCGSGVLAIAAVKLGARAAVGVDIDPDALDNARENAALNDLGDRIRFELGDFRQMSLRSEIVMANLTGGLLERSAEALAHTVAPAGSLIVSGFLDCERAAVIPALEEFLVLTTIAQEEEWMCATLRRRETL